MEEEREKGVGLPHFGEKYSQRAGLQPGRRPRGRREPKNQISILRREEKQPGKQIFVPQYAEQQTKKAPESQAAQPQKPQRAKPLGLRVKWALMLALVAVVGAGAALYLQRMDRSIRYEVATETQYKVITASCNIRAGAGMDYKVVGTAEQGELLRSAGQAVLNDSGTYWYEVSMDDGATGWVSQAVVAVL